MHSADPQFPRILFRTSQGSVPHMAVQTVRTQVYVKLDQALPVHMVLGQVFPELECINLGIQRLESLSHPTQ
jgi:hypothetical protein